ncbi:MAG: hypothetical protein ACT4QF_24340 [Sporichthyaceae bacterium]
MIYRSLRSTVPALAVGTLALAAGCTGQPTVVPAGSAGLDLPPSASAPVRADAKAVETAAQTATPRPRSRTQAPPRATPARNVVEATQRPARADAEQPTTPKAKAKVPVASAAAPRAATAALPPTGTYRYAVTGTSSLGPPPATSTLVVADGGAGRQLWTLDFRRQDGAGIVEELTLRQDNAGAHLTAYRLDASTGIAGVILEFAPERPALLSPSAGRAGTTWRFDLGTSEDGCATAKGVGTLLDPGSASSLRTFQITTTVRTVGPASCIQLNGERTQEIGHPRDSLLPTTIDSDLQGTVAGVAFAATIAAERAPTESRSPARPRILPADRLRR